MSPFVALMILAAGGSTRMGRPKQLLEWKGTSLVGHAVNTAAASMADQILLILGSDAETVKEQLPALDIDLLYNPEWQSGLGTSISAGMKHFLSLNKTPDAVIIMLCDQPLIDANHLDHLIHGWVGNDKKIAVTAYKKGIGVPAVFSREFYPQLASMEGEHGARDLLRQNANDCLVIDAGIKIMDIDTAGDYDRLREIAAGNT